MESAVSRIVMALAWHCVCGGAGLFSGSLAVLAVPSPDSQPDAPPKYQLHWQGSGWESTRCVFGKVQLPLHVPFWGLG